MDNSKSKNQKGLKLSWASIGMFMGVFTALMAVVLDPRRIDLLRGVSIGALILCVGIVTWLSFKVLHIGSRAQLLVIMALYVINAGFLLWIGTWLEPQSSTRPVKFVTYYDFESKSDLDSWGEGAELSSEHSFDGEKALKVFLPISTNPETTFYLQWQHEFEADVIIGQIYWPNQDDINLDWAQVCVPFEDWSCTFISKEHGWNTFVLDLSEMRTADGQNTLNNVKLPGIVLQGLFQPGNLDLKNIPIYIDSMQIYIDGQE